MARTLKWNLMKKKKRIIADNSQQRKQPTANSTHPENHPNADRHYISEMFTCDIKQQLISLLIMLVSSLVSLRELRRLLWLISSDCNTAAKQIQPQCCWFSSYVYCGHIIAHYCCSAPSFKAARHSLSFFFVLFCCFVVTGFCEQMRGDTQLMLSTKVKWNDARCVLLLLCGMLIMAFCFLG